MHIDRRNRVSAKLQDKDLKFLCTECPHYPECRTPCKPVEILLVHENRIVKEEYSRERILIIRDKKTHTQNETSLLPQHRSEEADKIKKHLAASFSTKNDSAFSAFQPKLKQTAIFIERFFKAEPFEDIASRYDLNIENVWKQYRNAVSKIHEVLQNLDSLSKVKEFIDFEKIEANFSPHQRWFLFNRLLGIRTAQIAELEGLDPVRDKNRIQKGINKISKQIEQKGISNFKPAAEFKGPREPSDYTRYEQKKAELLRQYGKGNRSINIRKTIAQALGYSEGKIAMADAIYNNADEDLKERLRAGEITIGPAYKSIKGKR